MELHPGTYLGGRFQIERKLGQGGMGIVYSAFDMHTHHRVAVKSLSPELMAMPEISERFKREAQAMAALQHPNIVLFLQWIEEPGLGWFIAMEFVQGRDFDKLIEQQGAIPPLQAIELITPVLAALSYAHGLGVIHRDIKPANVMLLDEGTVKVLDFGTAKLAGASQMTKVGQAIGTSVYMPIEQLQGVPATHQVDLYALGITLYEMVTGQVPYYHDDPIAQMKLMQQANPAPPSSMNRALPRELDQVILKAIARDPKQRFQDAGEFYHALEPIRQRLQAQSGGQAAVGHPSGGHAHPSHSSGEQPRAASSSGAAAPVGLPGAAASSGGSASLFAWPGLGVTLGATITLAGMALAAAGLRWPAVGALGAGFVIWLAGSLGLAKRG